MAYEETTEHEGVQIRIVAEDNPSNPRKEFDHAAKMVCWHRRYNLGDEQPKCSGGEWARNLAAELVKANDADLILDEHVSRILKKHVAILPLYLYDHSGITMSTGRFSCPWDSCQVGWIYMTLEDCVKNWCLSANEAKSLDFEIDDWTDRSEKNGKKITLRKAAERLMESEVNEYDQYLTGDVWGYVIEDVDGVEGDSCWGFYGKDYCIEQAKEAAIHMAKRIKEEVAEKAEMECRDIVTA